jgi:hypothetical protein
VTWLHEGKGYRCERHGETFSLTSSCPQCAVEPAPHQDSEAPALVPPGCTSSVELEAEHVADAATLLALIVAQAPPPGPGQKRQPLDVAVLNSIGKLYAERTKALRSAGEYAKAREAQAELHRLEAREREMQQRGGH